MIGTLLSPLLEKLPENNRVERIWKIAQVDFKKRFYNDRLGLVWALANPLSQIGIYYFVFTRIFNRGEKNYALYIFCGIIIWLAFTEASNKGSALLKQKKYLLENIQFNWLDLYFSNMISVTMGLVFNLLAYGVISMFYSNPFGEYFFYFPIVLATWFMVGLGTGIILGLIRPVFDDIVHIWNIFLRLGFWASGVFFPGTFYLENHIWVPYLNPFIGIILNTRACLLVDNEFYPFWLVYNFAFAACFLGVAILLFNKFAKRVTEKL